MKRATGIGLRRPHTALGAEMTEDYDERSALVAFRNFFSQGGGLFVLLVGFLFFFVPTPEFEKGQLNAAAYPPFAGLLSLLIAGSIFWTAWGTRSTRSSLLVAPEGPRVSFSEALIRVFGDMRSALQNGTFRWLFAGTLSMFIIVGANTTLDLYILTYFWDFDGSDVLFVIIAYPVGVLLGVPFSPFVLGKWGKKTALMVSALMWSLWQMLPITLRLIGEFPENGDALLVPLLVGIKIVQGIFTVQGDVAVGALVADLADEHELKTGKRQEGVFFAASSFSAKATVGLGSILGGLALEIIDWPAGSHIQTAADVPAQTLVNLGIVYGPLIASFAFVSVWCWAHVRLSRERHASILAQLTERRAGALEK